MRRLIPILLKPTVRNHPGFIPALTQVGEPTGDSRTIGTEWDEVPETVLATALDRTVVEKFNDRIGDEAVANLETAFNE